MRDPNRYTRIVERIFHSRYREGDGEVAFLREDIKTAAAELGIALPQNLGDVVYSFRYRATLPASIQNTAGENETWIIRPSGRAQYRFVKVPLQTLAPNPLLAETKVPDSTPGIVARYALNDEQGLLARLRYNRLLDIFTGVTCYSLQNHLRTTVPGMGQVETDEIYVGVDKRGAQFVFPVQAKGRNDRVGIVQIEQDHAMCAHKFPSLICRPVAAQFLPSGVIALLEFEDSGRGLVIASESHYRLVPPDQISAEELQTYGTRP